MAIAAPGIALAASVIACVVQAQPRQATDLLVLDGATVITGSGAPPISNAVVVVRNDRIEFVGRSESYSAPTDAGRMDLAGTWLIPGLSDMHVHIFGAAVQTQEVLNRLLAFGVTTMRIAAAPQTDDGEGGVITREATDAGRLLGPNVFTAGPMLDATTSWDWAAVVETSDEVRAEIRRQAAGGVDLVKFYAGLPSELMAAGIDEAHAAELQTIGHLGVTSWREAAELGIDHLVHSGLSGPTWELSTSEDADSPGDFSSMVRLLRALDFESPQTLALAELLAEKGVTVEPDLVLTEALYWSGDPELLAERLEPEVGPAWLTASWRSSRQPFGLRPDDSDRLALQQTFPATLRFIRVLHDKGVRLLVGTDLMNPWMTPGVAVHRELELLVEAGISELDVLTIATRNAAESVGRLDDFGTIEAGKQADMVLLRADPLVDIRNTRTIEWVMKNGVVLHPADLVQ